MSSQDIYQAIFDTAPYAMLLTDQQGVICVLNQKAQQLFGYNGQEMLGEPVEQLLTGQFSVKSIPDQFNTLSSANIASAAGYYTRAKRKDGWEFTVKLHVEALAGNGNDYRSITVQEEEAGAQFTGKTHGRDELFSALDKIDESVQLLNRQWQCLYANQALLRQCGLSRDDLLGYTMRKKFPGIEDSSLYKTIERCMEQQVAARVETEWSFPAGAPGIYDILIQPVQEGCFIWSADVTLQRQAEAELKGQNARLQALNDELKQSAYIVSHDLMEPLRTVAGFVDLLQVEYPDTLGEAASEYLSYIRQTNKRMQCVIKGLLNYSGAGRKMEFSQVDCEAIVQEVLNDLKLLIGETKAVIEMEALPILTANALELRLLFQNLLTNAMKFRKNEVVPEVRISCKEYPDYWEFYVRDNGIGIEARFKEKIFMIFHRLHNQEQYEGSGIGLAHCKKVAEMHGGNIWVESEPGEGSCFIFSISRHISQTDSLPAEG